MFLREMQSSGTDKRSANNNLKHVNVDEIELYAEDDNTDVILEDIKKCGNSEIIQLVYEGYQQSQIADMLGTNQTAISRMLTETYNSYKFGGEKID